MADRTSQDIKELEESSLRAFLEKSLAAISQKQDSQFQELKKLIISRTSPRSSTADSEPADQVNTDLKSVEIPRFDGSTDQDEDEDHGHHRTPNSTFIIDQEGTRSKLLPSPPPTWKYDVFVSFRGEDTRRGFVSHLFHAFKREGINCYRDVDGNERGQKVDSMLIEAIRRSRMAIIVLSRNYADSKWCLQELVEILSWNKQHCIHGHIVLPIFYDVSSSDVRHLRGMVGEAFGRCIAKNGQQNKYIWQNALLQVGTISSWSSNNRDEASTIQEIVDVLLERLAYSCKDPLLIKSSIVPNNNVSHLRTMLDMASNDFVQTIGICGTKGIGKTTLAHAACVHLNNAFEGCVILLEAIPAEKTTKDHLLQIQSKIAAELIKDDKLFQLSEDAEKNFLEIRMKLAQKKVLIVLDNVTTLEQVELVLVKDHEKFLGLGSRVVIISRDWGLLDKLKVDDIYMVPPLNHEESLKLFYHYVFMGRQDLANVIKGYEELSKNIVHYAAGLPPALESLGNSLSSNAPEIEWHTKLRELVGSRNCSDSKLYRYGPFGGRGRVESRWDDGEHCEVSGIELVIVDSVIKSIGVTYNNYGHPVGPVFHGSSISSSTVLPKKIKLDYPYEYLMAISGYIGKKETNEVTVRSLTLHTNRRTLGPFGDESKTGWPFYTQKTGAKIVGFFGASDSELQSIGVHVKQVSHTYPHHQFVGPFGQNNSTEAADWDHGAFTDIRKIIITKYRSRAGIISISCVYDNNGLPVEKLSRDTQRRSIDIEQVEVTLNYPTEYIVSMSGSYSQGAVQCRSFVRSLEFRTNLKTYGPYGFVKDLAFSTPMELGKIVGFYGTKFDGVGIQTIGAHFAPVYHMHPLTTIGPFGHVSTDAWDDGKHSGVKEILIRHYRGTIYYMRFTYADGNGGTVEGRAIAPNNSLRGQEEVKEVIKLDYPKEYLVSISGRVGSPEIDFNSNGIKSLSFKTNLREFGPHGQINEGDKSFSFKSDIAKIVGFHGTIKEYYGFSIGPSGEIIKEDKVVGFHGTNQGNYGYSIGPHLQLL